MEFTFGIITSEHSSQHIKEIVDQIKLEVPEDCREIIVVGGNDPNIDDVIHIPFNEHEKSSWITRKKNLVTQHSTKENIVYLHDYIGICPGWYKGQIKAGNDFDVRMDRIINFDGSRFRDWTIWPHNGNEMDSIVIPEKQCLIPYYIHGLSKYMYISGAYWIAKRALMLKYPLDENLCWGQGEDVKWSTIVREHHEFRMNQYSAVRILKPGKDRAFDEMNSETLKKVLSIANINQNSNRFKIIVPSYNNEDWVEFNIASVLNQTYTNYEVLYINDASTDQTYNKVEDIVGHLPNWKLVNNSENKGAAYNYMEFVDDFVEDDDIIVHLDGDDWFADDTVLSQLNDFYNNKGCWMTYGQFVVYDGNSYTQSNPQGTSYPEFVHEHRLYRRDDWRASHLRTYRGFLFKAIDKNDIKDMTTGEYYWHASDLAWAYPCLEMSGEQKIGVVDFVTHVYNQTKGNQVRTQERESAQNHYQEFEIRNKKVYKLGATGEKLPQVNVFGNYKESNSIPSKFSYVYNLSDGEFDMTLLEDGEIIRYLNGGMQINRGLIVADIHEAPHLLSQNDVYTAVKQNADEFDYILTYDQELLKLPNAIFRNGGYEAVLNKSVHTKTYPTLQDDSLIKVYSNKSKHISFITSNKTMTEGHRFRLQCANAIHASGIKGVDLFGVGINEIRGKIEGLKEYKFSIAVENGIHNNYFTEKILDCFLTGTIPIYRGCKNIGEFFNVDGFITFDTQEELLSIVSNLTDQDYYSKTEYIKQNFEKAKEYYYTNDKLFDKYFAKMINNQYVHN